MGGRRDLPISTSMWLQPISDDEWADWQRVFGQDFSASFRRKVDLCLLDFCNAAARHHDENRISVSKLKKNIKRLLKRAHKQQVLDDDFTQDQIFKISGCDPTLPFPKQAQIALDELGQFQLDATMSAAKPEALFCAVVFDLFKVNNVRVNLTSGSKRDSGNGLDPVSPTAIEAFILRYILLCEEPKIKDVDKIRKNIKRYQLLA